MSFCLQADDVVKRLNAELEAEKAQQVVLNFCRSLVADSFALEAAKARLQEQLEQDLQKASACDFHWTM